MKKICLFLAASMTLALSAAAFAAPTAADLTAGAVPEGDVISFGVRDMRAMEAQVANGSLIGRIVKKRSEDRGRDTSKMAACADTALSVSFNASDESLKTVVYVARLVEGATENDILNFPEGKDYKPDFTVKDPLKALATVTYEKEGMNALRFARLDREGRVYLLATNGDVAVFEKMAVAPETEPVPTHEDDTFWCHIDLTEELLDSINIKVKHPVRTEISFASTEKTLYMHVWNSLMGSMKGGVSSATEGKQQLELLTENLTATDPKMFGAGPLMGLFNLCCASLPENMELAQVFSGDSLKDVEASLADLKAETGLEWSDILSILRHNTTLGIAGKVNFLGTEFPGIWLHVQGLTGEKAEGLVAAIKKEIGVLGAGATDFEKDGWKGFSLSKPLSAVAASGPDGMVVALMNYDQFSKVPEIPVELAQTVEPRGIALGVNFKDLQPELLKLYECYSALLPADTDAVDEEVEDTKETIKAVLNNLGMLEAVEIYAIGSECVAVEVTPKPEFLNMMFPPVLPEEPQTQENAATDPAA